MYLKWKEETSGGKKDPVASLRHCVIRQGVITDRLLGIEFHIAAQVLHNTWMKDCNIQQFTDIKSFIDRLLRFLRICNTFSFSMLVSFTVQSEGSTESGTQNTRPDQYSYTCQRDTAESNSKAEKKEHQWFTL